VRLSLPGFIGALERKSKSAYVLYGSNSLLIQGVLQEINASFSHASVAMNDLGAYANDLDTPLLFGAKPYVVHAEGTIQWPKVGPILRAWPRNHAVVVNGPSIPLPWSKSPEIAILPCYDFTLDDSKFMVARVAQRENIVLNDQTLRLCAELTQWGQWHSMMSVLSLAALHDGTLSMDEVGDLFPQSGDETALVILDTGRAPCWSGPVSDPIPMIRSWQRMMVQLLQYQYFLPQLGSEKAMDAVRPSVFFKHKNPLIKASCAWSKSRIIRCLSQLMNAEVAVKKNQLSVRTLLDRLMRLC
jgi:hypothetical protein